MTSIFQSFQNGSFFPKNQALPVSVSQSDSNSSGTNEQGGVRKRVLSSLSLHNIHNSLSSPATSSWAFRRSNSVSSMGEYAGSSVRKWWDWGWSWILSRKPTFAKDLEMNDQETSILGCHNKGSWRHVFYKVRSDLRRLLGSDRVALPQTFRYDSYNYSQNFDRGKVDHS